MFWLAVYLVGFVTMTAGLSAKFGAERGTTHDHASMDVMLAWCLGMVWPATLITYLPWLAGLQHTKMIEWREKALAELDENAAEVERVLAPSYWPSGHADLNENMAEVELVLVSSYRPPGHSEICRCEGCAHFEVLERNEHE